MTATRKLFLAAMLVAAGIGVARLLGEPAARFYAPQLTAAPVQEPVADSASIPVIGPSTASQSSGARLVPDFAVSDPYGAPSDPALSETPPPLLPVPGADDNNSSSGHIALAESRSPIGPARYEARASLRDEAPRPLEMEQPATIPLESAPPTTATSVATIVSFDQPIGEVGSAAMISPPPWPPQAEIETNDPRTHIIVDGDSLERLAARYLDDPQRGDEIYQANRELLASPDLLPIGAELHIPSRTSVPTIESTSPQSFVPRTVAIHTSTRAHCELVPVRSIPSAPGMMPRAQLVRPLAIE